MLRTDKNGKTHAVLPSRLFHNAGYVPHPLQRLGVVAPMPFAERATLAPKTVAVIYPPELHNMPAPVGIRRI